MVNFIDISKINCWIGQLSPGGSNQNNDYFKEECINSGYFRLGWTLDDNEKYKNKDIKEIYFFKKKREDKEGNIDLYFSKDLEKQEWKKNNANKDKKESMFEKEFEEKERSLDKALDSMSTMKIGDIIVTRFKGEYYIGRITETAKYLEQEQKDGSLNYRWSVKVGRDKNSWIKIPEKDMPGDIVGRFSQRRHPTIQRVGESSTRFKLLLIKIYQEKATDNKLNNIDIPKIILNKYNFTSALNYMNLEDLVYLYIKSLPGNEQFLLLPSTCKISKMQYEMDLIKPNREMITCQVKNREKIKWKEYKNEEDTYKKIYLFSGIEDYDDDEISEELKNTKNDINKDNKIIIINKENLFEFFRNKEKKSNEVEILKELINLDKYYEIKDETKKSSIPENWECKERFSSKKEQKKEYKINKFLDVIFKSDSIYFSSEFNSLIQYKECNNEEFINELKEAYGIK